MSEGVGALVAIFIALTGVAIVAIFFSKQSQSPQVISSIGQAFGGMISAAVSPLGVTGTGNFAGAAPG